MEQRETGGAGKTLLALVEIGGYPDYMPLYRRLGYEVVVERSVRKAVGLLKKLSPRVIVAEFNYEPAFRDRTSNLESLLAVVQRLPDTRVIVFYESDFAQQLQKLRGRFTLLAAFPFPVDEGALEQVLRRALEGG